MLNRENGDLPKPGRGGCVCVGGVTVDHDGNISSSEWRQRTG